jgi:putative redox protein
MADVSVLVKWTGEGLQFDAGAIGGMQIRVDGDAKTGPSPLVTLLLALGGCMAADVVDITTKSRAVLTGLELGLEGDRAADYPRRYTRIVMTFKAHGVPVADQPKVERALDMSRDKYCSVLHSLRSDIAFEYHLAFA